MTATTGTHQAPPSLEDLLAQSPWARRLAYRLVHEAEAPDLLQDAWIAARATDTERPDQVPEVSWFAGVVRILGLRRLRADARRRRREQQASAERARADDPAPSAEALLERAQLHRLLSELVVGLGEPYRSTVVLRYQEGLSAADIARRLDIPAGTVRWRLKEALDQLRAELERRLGDRRTARSWAVALAPLAGPRLAATALAPGAAVAWRLSRVVSVMAVAAIAVVGGSSFLISKARRGGAGTRASAPPVVSSAEPAALPTNQPARKESDMKRFASTVALVFGLGAGTDAAGAPAAGAKPAGPPPVSKVARFQVPLGGAPIKGPAGAKVTILEFTDYECPFCANASRNIKEVLAAYPRDVRYQVINQPLSFHKKAPLAARAALAAAEQGKYWEMHERIFSHPTRLDRADFERDAGELGLDVEKFKADIDGAAVDRLMEMDEATAQSVRTTGTPTYFINGRMVAGARPAAELKARVAEELAFANQVLATGVPAAQLYNEITKHGAPEIPEAPPSGGQVVVSDAVKKCVKSPKMMAELKGVAISPGGTFTKPKDRDLTDEQMKVLGCLSAELADKGVGLRL